MLHQMSFALSSYVCQYYFHLCVVTTYPVDWVRSLSSLTVDGKLYNMASSWGNAVLCFTKISPGVTRGDVSQYDRSVGVNL